MVKLWKFLAITCAAVPVLGTANSSFQAGSGSWQLAAPVVGNIDADAALEIVVAARASNGQWLVDAYKHSGARIPGFPHQAGGKPVNASPTLVDLDGDNRKEILFTRGNDIVALRGNGTVLWTHSVTPLNYVPDGGFHALTNGFYLSGLPLFQPALPLTAEFYSEVSPPIVADIDANGEMEVLTAWKIDPDKVGPLQDYNPFINDYFGAGEWGITGEEWSGGVIINDARTGARKFVYHFHQLVEAGLALAQLDHDDALEVLVLNDADSVAAFDLTQPHGFFGSGMLHRLFGKNLRLLSGSYLTGVDIHAADLDGDGLDEVLASASRIRPNWQPSETILDDDGSILWREWNSEVPLSNVHGWLNSATLIPINPDQDNRIDVLGFNHSNEITFRTWDGVKLISRAGWPKTFGNALPTPPVVGDVDGDAEEEIVIGTYVPSANPSSGKLFVYSLSGAQKAAIDVPGGVKHIPTIADVDGDGGTEVVFRAMDGRVHIRSFGRGSPNRISWATHRGNAEHDGNRGGNLYPPGTPILGSRTAGQNSLSISWRIPSGFAPSATTVYRAEKPEGPFVQVSALEPHLASFTDHAVVPGRLYVYEIAAHYGGTVLRSAPVAIAADYPSNLITNGGFEFDDDRGWDKWFSGDVPWQNMTGSGLARTGSRSLEVKLAGHGSNSTITQYSHYGVPEDYLPLVSGRMYSFGGFIKTTAFAAETRHWFEWDSSRTAENTNARPALPWPEYFTPALKSGAAGADWTYLNRVFTAPGFPNAQLRHRFTTPAPVTGSVYLDDVFFRLLPAPEDPRWQTLLPFGARWRYTSSTPPPNWTTPSYDPSGWTEAPAKFGAGGGPRNIVTALPGHRPAYYFRTSFITSMTRFEEFLLSATCTDDYGGIVYPLRLWLNGTEVATGGIEAVTGEGNIVKYFDLTPFVSLLRSGTNTVAFQLSNTWQPTWDNVAFDVSLRAIPAVPSPLSDSARLTRITFEPGWPASIQATTDAAGTWQVQSSDSSRPFSWRAMQNLTFNAPGTITVQDTGQNGRPAPSQVPFRAYRLLRQP